MGRKIIKKIGGDRIGSGGKMNVSAHGYGYSTHDVSKIRRTSMTFGTIVPMGKWFMPSGSRLRLELDALITTNALLYQLYGSCKFQLDVFEARLAIYNPKMLLNLNDQGYNISDIKFPQMELETNAIDIESNTPPSVQQVNPSSLLRYLGIAGNGFNTTNITEDVVRQFNANWLLFYYQTIKEYYANKQEKKGYIIHNDSVSITYIIKSFDGSDTNVTNDLLSGETPVYVETDGTLIITKSTEGLWENIKLKLSYIKPGVPENDSFIYLTVNEIINNLSNYLEVIALNDYSATIRLKSAYIAQDWTTKYYQVIDVLETGVNLKEFDLKAIDRMAMEIMSKVDSPTPIIIDKTTELPYGASFMKKGDKKCINGTMEGLAIGTYQSDVFNNWLDNATINALSNKSKIKVDGNGEFTIDMLNITQKLYNYDMRIGVTDGTLDEWREMTYGQASKSKSLKPVYAGGLSKEILFDMIVSTAATEDEPLGSIASRGQFGAKHKGGYVQIDADEEKLVLVLAKITPRIVYSQGNDWDCNLKSLEDIHKPEFDKIGYQNLITDTMHFGETGVGVASALTTKSAGKQPAWMWYRTNFDDALGAMAWQEDYKVFGRNYELESNNDGGYRIKDLTTYIDPEKFNDVFAYKSREAQNFDVQVGMHAKMTLVMSEEVIPNL